MAEGGLAALVSDARAAWARFEIPPDDFTRYLEERAGGETSHARDLYLACGCARGLPAALAAFDAGILSEVDAFVARFRGGPHFVDEVRQVLRERLLVGSPPRIASYTGRGPLRAWVRVAAVRAAVDLRRQEDGNVGEEVSELAAASAGLDVEHLRARYQGELQGALERALAELSVKQRTLLRMHFVDGFTLDALAVTQRVHRATIARWIASARGQLLDGMQRRLAAELRLTASELRSVTALVMSQLHVSVARFFAPARKLK